MTTELDLDKLERLCIPLDGLLTFLREAWRDDGAEGDSVHRLCDIVEKAPALIAEARYAAKARVVVETFIAIQAIRPMQCDLCYVRDYERNGGEQHEEECLLVTAGFIDRDGNRIGGEDEDQQ